MDNKGTVHADGYRSAEVSTHRRLFHVIISGMEKIMKQAPVIHVYAIMCII